jgi:hypothetical protein
MKKIIPILIIGILILSGVGAGAYFIQREPDQKLQTKSDSIQFSEPVITENEQGYLTIELKESSVTLQNTGEPILPIINKKYTFPLGTAIKDVQVIFTGNKQYSLSKKITPTPYPATTLKGKEINGGNEIENAVVYTSQNLYPEQSYTYSLHAGLEQKNHVIILNLQCYPIRYLPAENLLYSVGAVSIDIIYEPPEKPVVFNDNYDMVIIAPDKFSKNLQSLIDHKNSHGIQTTLKTTESIYAEFSGRDQPEKIKYFIKSAIENWNITYVLLVGGKKSLLFGNWGIEGPRTPNDDLWYVPVRYNNLLDSTGEAGCLTDLYFADIYKVEGNEIVFDDWDSDSNDVFAEWTLDAKDILDLYPDVAVGRLACRNNYEVKIMVDKIITYESSSPEEKPWFNRIVGVGGDSFDDQEPLGDDIYEGEARSQLAFDYLNGFTAVRVWASQRDTGGLVPSDKDIINTINDGCGFLYFAGHGNPMLYNTHWVHDYTWTDTPGGINIYDMIRLRNKEKLPICMIGACHNSEFNTSFFNFLTEGSLDGYPTPECWSWTLTRKIGGGAIATIGYTGLEWVATYGWDTDDIPDCTQYFSGYIDSRFFYAYGVSNIQNLGEAWSQAITDYLDKFPGMRKSWDCKTAQQWLLLGDPSLLIGGYP